MATKLKNTTTSTGICEFCKSEVNKNKMTQHLKFCKQRLASIAAEEKESDKTKTRLLHIFAEGKYNLQYWLRFEVPASASLWSLDSFLKAMWIDDLDHLSGFTINGTNYRDAFPGEFFSFSQTEEVSEEEDSEEENNANISALIDKSLLEYVEMLAPSLKEVVVTFPSLTEWIADKGIEEGSTLPIINSPRVGVL